MFEPTSVLYSVQYSLLVHTGICIRSMTFNHLTDNKATCFIYNIVKYLIILYNVKIVH